MPALNVICETCTTMFTVATWRIMQGPVRHCSNDCRRRDAGIIRNGYRYVWCGDRYRPEHRLVWERHHGLPLPDDVHIHHIDENKLNNHISNLQPVNPRVHPRLHAEYERRADGWWKKCGRCHQMKPVATAFHHRSNGHVVSRCKACRKDYMREWRAKRS